MKNFLTVMAGLFFTVILIVGCSANNSGDIASKDAESTDDIVTIAESFIDMFVNGEYEEATQYFDETMVEEFPAPAIEQTWTMLRGQLGEFIDSEYEATTEVQDFEVVTIVGTFEAADVLFTVSFNENNEISGFYIQ